MKNPEIDVFTDALIVALPCTFVRQNHYCDFMTFLVQQKERRESVIKRKFLEGCYASCTSDYPASFCTDLLHIRKPQQFSVEVECVVHLKKIGRLLPLSP